jgi:bifunctional UDP-N-acetylglucosamine pyrophosphorylase/glucosamine-1-phosphate N-acetyltransferase
VGTNTRYDFANVARLARERIVGELMDRGVTVVDPDTTYVDAGVIVGADTVVHPNTFLEGTTRIGGHCEIGPNTRLVDTTVGDEAMVTFTVARKTKIGPAATVGPFVSLRPGTVLKKGAHVGTFAEMKNAEIGEGAKVPHFSYLGDVSVGPRSNIAAGTITSNYDGKDKHRTKIGDDVFIGSDTILVAPVRVGSGAYTGAGSVVTRDVPAGGLVYGVPAEPRKRKAKAKAKGSKKKPAKKRTGG